MRHASGQAGYSPAPKREGKPLADYCRACNQKKMLPLAGQIVIFPAANQSVRNKIRL
jgi:hypothetical protein